MQAIRQDVRYGFRGLRNRPAFTVLAVLTFGLGIDAATTIFSVIYNVMLDPFPYMDAHRVGAIMIRDSSSTGFSRPIASATRRADRRLVARRAGK